MFKQLEESIDLILKIDISEDRKEILEKLVSYISLRRKKELPVNLNFICTHNSRRSHLAQIWGQTAAAHYDIKNVHCYSGGTEATAMYHCIKDTLVNQGFIIHQLSENTNPIYAIKISESSNPIWAFSKKYDHGVNPQANYAAVMTCSHADKNCPIVYGSEARIPVTYLDPKAYDESPLQKQKYLEKSQEIGAEMLYVFSQIS